MWCMWVFSSEYQCYYCIQNINVTIAWKDSDKDTFANDDSTDTFNSCDECEYLAQNITVTIAWNDSDKDTFACDDITDTFNSCDECEYLAQNITVTIAWNDSDKDTFACKITVQILLINVMHVSIVTAQPSLSLAGLRHYNHY